LIWCFALEVALEFLLLRTVVLVGEGYELDVCDIILCLNSDCEIRGCEMRLTVVVSR